MALNTEVLVCGIWEINSVCVDLRVEGQVVVGPQLRPAEARALAALLVAAADEIDRGNAELDTWFWNELNPWVSARRWDSRELDPLLAAGA